MKDNHDDDVEPADNAPDAPEAEVSDLAIETLAGDVRDRLVTRIKQVGRPWSTLTEEEQHDLANGLEMDAKELVRQVVRILTDYDVPSVVVKLGKVEIVGGDKSGIKAVVEAGNYNEARDVLGGNAGKRGRLLFYDSDDFMGERAPVEIDPDQPELPDQGQTDTDEADGAPEPEADQDEDSAEAELSMLRVLAKLGPDEAANIANPGMAESLLERGLIKTVGRKTKAQPQRYAITPAGRSAIEGDD